MSLNSTKQTLTCPLVRTPRERKTRQVLGYRVPEQYLYAVQHQKVEIRAEMCRRSFSFFVKEFWREIDSEDLIWNWHLDVLCHEVEQVYRRVFQRVPKEYDLIVNVPPGTSKSKIVTIMAPIWGWLNDPTLKTINGSYSGDLSLEHADAARDLIKSRRFSIYFPKLKIRPDKDTKGSYQILYQPRDEDSWKLGGSRYAASVGGAVTGMHALIINVDDPLNPKKAASEVELKAANHWMEQTLSTRKINKRVTPTILVMQRLHDDDPAGKLLAKMKAGKKKVRHICLPGEIYAPKTKALVNPPCLALFYKDEKLDPVRMGDEVLDELMADLGQYGYAAQIGQNPSPPGGGMFKTEKIQIISAIPENNISRIVRYWDKAGTDAKDTNPGSAHTAGVKMALLKDSKWTYAILDVKRGQWEAFEREEHIRQCAQLDGKKVQIWVEQEPGSGGKESAQGTIKNLAGFSAHAEKPSGDKVFRADPFSVQVNWGNVVMVQGDWNQDYIAEMASFPFGKLKDQVDASSGAFNQLSGKNKAGAWGRS